jgi:hypothetical protein
MPAVNDFAHELEVEEKKHKRVVEYDLVAFGVIILIVAFAAVATLVLKSAYRPVKEMKLNVAQALQQCNKSILTAAEAYRKNTTDYEARARVDAGKSAFDAAVIYYGTVARKGTGEGLMLAAVDSCYRVGLKFRATLASQWNLKESGVEAGMIGNMENDLKLLKEKRDSLMSGIESYNSSRFFLNFSWITPYSGTIEYNPVSLPEMELVVQQPPPVKANDR